MNKGQALALFLAGAAAGVGGDQVAKVLGGSAHAQELKPIVHAVDLRRAQAFDAGVRVTAYGWEPLADGGVRDLGRARSCRPAPAACMDNVDCEW